MEIKVLKIESDNSILIKERSLDSYADFYINGSLIDDNLLKSNIILNENDVLEYVKKRKDIEYYKKGNKTLTVEEYASHKTYYDSDSTEEETLRAIANRKKLEGFEPVYEDDSKKKVVFNIIGIAPKVKSDFISFTYNSLYSFSPLKSLFTVSGKKVSMDEYKKLSLKHSDHAKFEVPDRGYLQYVKVNDTYVFSSLNYCGDRDYIKTFESIEEAISYENNVRETIKKAVNNVIFSKNITPVKKLDILKSLVNTRKLKTVDAKNEMLDLLIKDLRSYLRIADEQ